MDNPRLRHIPKRKPRATRPSSDEEKKMRSAAEFAASEADKVKRFQDHFGGDAVIQFPVVNPIKIIEKAQYSPMDAAILCQQACGLLGKGYQLRLKQYISTAYFLACGIRDNEEEIKRLHYQTWDNRTKNYVKIELVKADILHYLFVFIFHEGGFTTKDRANHYAQALKIYFQHNEPHAKVADHLYKFGPDKLRRVAQRLNKMVVAAQELALKSGDPAAITMDDALREIQAEEAAKRSIDPQEEVTDYGPRELPPMSETQDNAETDEADENDGEEYVDNDESLAASATDEESCGNENLNVGAVDSQDKDYDSKSTDFIEGHVIDERLEEIMLETMNFGGWLGKQLVGREAKEHSVLTVMRLTIELVALRRLIKGI